MPKMDIQRKPSFVLTPTYSVAINRIIAMGRKKIPPEKNLHGMLLHSKTPPKPISKNVACLRMGVQK
jgi:hypothetical protein